MNAGSELQPGYWNGATLSEVRIVYSLAIQRVFYSSHREYLYFCDSESLPVRQTICAVMRGMGVSQEIEAVCLDVHRLFAPACRVRLMTTQLAPVRAALRLSGVEVMEDRLPL